MSLFKSKYRIESSRMPDWDYSANASYFITICTSQKEHYFGKIINDVMMLSDMGKIAEEFLVGINSHFSHAKTDCHVVMPNHIHAIIIVDRISDFAENVSITACRHDDEDVSYQYVRRCSATPLQKVQMNICGLYLPNQVRCLQ